MGSNTKSMVATVAAKVVEQGRINWTSTAKEIFHDTGLMDVNEGYWSSTLELFLRYLNVCSQFQKSYLLHIKY